MARQKFKYNINHFISLLPKAQTMEWISMELEKEGIPPRTFFRDKSILPKESHDISAERLLIYARFFGVTLEQMYGYTRNVKPVYRRFSHPQYKTHLS